MKDKDPTDMSGIDDLKTGYPPINLSHLEGGGFRRGEMIALTAVHDIEKSKLITPGDLVIFDEASSYKTDDVLENLNHVADQLNDNNETPDIVIVSDDTEARRKVIESLSISDPGKKILVVDDYSQIPDHLKSKALPEPLNGKLLGGYKATNRNGGMGVVPKNSRPKIEGVSLRDMFIP